MYYYHLWIAIHPFSATYQGPGSQGQQCKQKCTDLPLPSYLLQLFRHQDIPKPAKRCNLCPGSASVPSPRARCLQHQLLRGTWLDAWTTSTRCVRCGGLKARLWVPPKHLALYPVHTGWSPATLQRKLSSVTWIRDLLLSVSTQRSRLQVCVGK